MSYIRGFLASLKLLSFWWQIGIFPLDPQLSKLFVDTCKINYAVYVSGNTGAARELTPANQRAISKKGRKNISLFSHSARRSRALENGKSHQSCRK
jgi:hypothetical protein